MQNILITGCSSGIGLETALLLKEKKLKVYASARKAKDVQKLKDLGFDALKINVRKKKHIKQALDYILQKDGKLDLVFNNAGYGQAGALEDIKTSVLKKQFNTNFFALHELSIQSIKIFRTQGYGKLIQHSSILGLISLKFRGAYNSSKYAIEGLCDTLRLELKGSNIYVSTINTGPVTSKFRENALKNFNKYVDKENSYFKEIYKTKLQKRLEAQNSNTPFSLEAISVANKVFKITQSKKPKPRYYVTKASYILAFFKRILSTSLLDKLLSKID